MKPLYNITYTIITDESATYGDHAAHGYLTHNLTTPRKYGGYIPKTPATWSLREALDILGNHNSEYEPPQADGYPVTRQCPPRWVSVSDFAGYFPDEGVTELSLHFPPTLTPSTRVRIARLMGCYGVE